MAIYSLNLLTTRAQCDAVLAVAAEKRKVLTFRDTESDYRTDNTAGLAQELGQELASLNTYIATFTPFVAGLAAGRERDEQANTLRKKTDRRDDLVARQNKAGGEKLVARELNQALLEPQVPIVDDLTAQVTAHRATLSA